MSQEGYTTRPDRDRPAVLTVWQEFLDWTFERTNAIPKGQRFTFGQRIDRKPRALNRLHSIRVWVTTFCEAALFAEAAEQSWQSAYKSMQSLFLLRAFQDTHCSQIKADRIDGCLENC